MCSRAGGGGGMTPQSVLWRSIATDSRFRLEARWLAHPRLGSSCHSAGLLPPSLCLFTSPLLAETSRVLADAVSGLSSRHVLLPALATSRPRPFRSGV